MIPLLDPTVVFAPVAAALAWLGVVAVAGTVAVAGLAAWTVRPLRAPRRTVVPFPPRLRKAA